MRAKILGFIAFALVALGVGGCVGTSDELGTVEQSLVNPPTNLAGTATSGYQVDLTWDAVPNAQYYVIMRGTAPGNETTLTSTSAASPTYSDQNVTPNTQYSYQVRVAVAGEESPPSNEVLVTTLAGIAPPANVMAVAVQTTRIDVSWTAAAGATKYYLFRAIGAGPMTYVTTVLGTSYADGGLTPNTTYSYMVHSADAANRESGDSNIATAMTPGTPPQISPPMTVTATPISSSRIQIDWTAATNAVKYYVFQAQGAGPYSYIGTAVGTSFTSTGLAPATTYSYVIQSVDFFDIASADSAPPATATTFGTGGQTTVPTGVTASPVSSSRINVSWTASTNAVKYYVFQALGNGTMAYVGTAFTTSYLATGLAASTQYSYEVQAVDANDVASASSTPRAFATTFAAGLGARFKFDEQSGSTTSDSVGGRTGSLVGGAAFATMDKPPVYDEDFHNYSHISIPANTAGAAVSVPEDSLFQGIDDFSVSFWAQLPSGSAGTIHLMGKRADGCGAVQWDLYQDGTGLHLASDTATVNFGASIPSATWTQVGVTYTGGTARLFVNGIETGSGAWAVDTVQSVPVQFGNAGSCGNGAQLLLDEVRFYSVALTNAEMGRLGIRPAAPSNMTGVVNSSTAATFTWDPVANAELYVIFRGATPASQTAYTSIPASTPQWIEDHFMPSETSSWHIRVVVNGLLSLPSNVVTVTTNPPPQPPTVSVMAHPTDPSRAFVSWTAVTNAQKYYVFRNANGGAFSFVTTVTAPELSLNDSPLPAGTYGYQVVAVDNGNVESAPSATATITIP